VLEKSGTAVGDVCRQLGVSQATFYAWKKKYADLGVSQKGATLRPGVYRAKVSLPMATRRQKRTEPEDPRRHGRPEIEGTMIRATIVWLFALCCLATLECAAVRDEQAAVNVPTSNGGERWGLN
jgi:transposase-like protein